MAIRPSGLCSLRDQQEGKTYGQRSMRWLAKKGDPVPDQPVHYTFWLNIGSDGAGLVCSHGNSQRRMGGSLFCLCLSAAVSVFISRRCLGGPLPQKNFNHGSGCADRAGYLGHDAGNSSHFIRDIPAFGPSGNVGDSLPGGRNPDSGGQCSDSADGSGRTAYAVQWHQCGDAVRCQFCGSGGSGSGFCGQQFESHAAD